MREFKIVEITPAEHREWCEQQIKEKGLMGSVREQLDEIVGLCRAMDYSGFGDVTFQRMMDISAVMLADAELKKVRKTVMGVAARLIGANRRKANDQQRESDRNII